MAYGDFRDPGIDPAAPPPRQKPLAWLWLLAGIGVVLFLPCAGCLGWVWYIGVYGPDTSVYAGNQVPARFIEQMREIGALGEDEELLYFYSDALTDIRKGFYFVSDRRVVVYSQERGAQPLTEVQFDEIESVELHREESFFIDSVVLIRLKDGRPVTFPVSSDADMDQLFYEAIRERAAPAGDDEQTGEEDADDGASDQGASDQGAAEAS